MKKQNENKTKQEMETEEIFLTPNTLASRWKMRLTTLSQWRWNGKGPPYLKMGKKILYDREEIEEFETRSIRQNTSQ